MNTKLVNDLAKYYTMKPCLTHESIYKLFINIYYIRNCLKAETDGLPQAIQAML